MDSRLLKLLAGLIEDYSGIHISHGNTFNFSRRADDVLRNNGLSGTDFPFSEEILIEIIDHLVIHETYLFREPAYLPFLLSLAEKSSGSLRLLSLGVSSGEEAYSIAAYMAEHGCAAKVKISAADISRGSIERAEAGIFSRYSLRKTEPRYRKFFSSPDGENFQADKCLREMIDFRQYNLLGNKHVFQPADFDAVSARNLFIYFGGKLNQALAAAGALIRDGGCLITTPVEYGKIKNFGQLRGDINLVSK